MACSNKLPRLRVRMMELAPKLPRTEMTNVSEQWYRASVVCPCCGCITSFENTLKALEAQYV
jgi:hypothetical protein